MFFTSCSTMVNACPFVWHQALALATFERRLRRSQSCLGGGRAKHADRRASPSEGGRSPPPSSEACVVPQILHAIGALPGELGLRAAEVAVGGGLLVNGPAKVEVFDDARRREVEVAPDQLLEAAVRHL